MRRALVLCLLLAACRPDATPHAAPSPTPTTRYTTFGPVKLPMRPGWTIAATPQRAGDLEVDDADTTTPDGRLVTGVLIAGRECFGETGQLTKGTIAGHPVHLGRYAEERNYAWVITFDDTDYCMRVGVFTDHVVVTRDLKRVDGVVHTLVDA